MNTICIVAIASDELPFIDEWIAYHLILGIDHIFIYDDEIGTPLVEYLKDYSSISVIPWYDKRNQSTNMRNQVSAYFHAKENLIKDFEWVAFIDVDEFLVIKDVMDIKRFLLDFRDVGSISLNWHVFGHNGHFEDPDGLITQKLTRRMNLPSINVKSITKTAYIRDITPHYCRLISGRRTDANGNRFEEKLYTGKTARAHVNHYQCRSFERWMKRAKRGDVNYNLFNCPPEQQWRLTEESCLKQFVTTVALNKNEVVDNYMLNYGKLISEKICRLVKQ